MAVDPIERPYTHPLYENLLSAPGLSVLAGSLDELLTWGASNSLWVFPMATSCCGIEFMASAASRVDLDRMGSIVRATPRQADVIVVAGTITVKMAPRVKKLWDQMPEPKWCVAMGSCAISGDFYRDLYPVVAGIDTFLPVDVYVPGCPPNPEALMDGLLHLQEKVRLIRAGKWAPPVERPETEKLIRPAVRRLGDPDRDPALSDQQVKSVLALDHEVDPRVDAGRRLPMASARALSEAISGDNARDLGALLKAHFGIDQLPVDPPPVVELAKHRALALVLKEAGYRLLGFIAATHWPPAAGSEAVDRYEVTYALRRPGPGSELVSWRVSVEGNEAIPSLVDLFAGADWQEREQFDLFGIVFSGHPDLRRILLPGDWEGHPLRRDYPSNAEHHPWR